MAVSGHAQDAAADADRTGKPTLRVTCEGRPGTLRCADRPGGLGMRTAEASRCVRRRALRWVSSRGG